MRPFFKIWINPTKAFSFLSEQDEEINDDNITILFALITLSIVLPRFSDINRLFGSYKIIGFVLALIVIGFLGTIFFKFVYSFVFWIIGKIFQGKATMDEIRLVLGYSLIPHLLNLVIGFLMVIPAIITKNFDLIFFQHPITLFIIWILSIRNLVFGLSFFNKFSYGYAILNIFLILGLIEGLGLLIKNLV